MSEHIDRKKEVLEALEKYHGIVTDACASIGLHRSTYYLWLNNDPEFKKAVDEIQEVALDFVESKLFQKINGIMLAGKEDEDGAPIVYEQQPSDTAIIFYLKTKGKRRGYIERTELTGADGADLNFKVSLNLGSKTDNNGAVPEPTVNRGSEEIRKA